jgi:hypothetical protein
MQFNWDGAEIVTLDASHETEILAGLDAECLDEKGRLKAVPASVYANRSRTDLALWCVRRGFYCLPTLELVEFLREQIIDGDTIEIGAGNGALGRAVGIRMTDSRQQERDDVQQLYQNIEQATVPYGEDVEKLTALEAVEKYRPTVVLGAWVTHRWNRDHPQRRGNMNGIDEGRILDKKFVKKYIFVGHEHVHALKPILGRPRETFRLPYLYSRSPDPRDVVWVWSRSRRLAG